MSVIPAFATAVAAWTAVDGIASDLVGVPVCDHAPAAGSPGSRVLPGMVAALALTAGGWMTSYGLRSLRQTAAATRSQVVGGVLLLSSFVPLVGGFAAFGLCYLVGLNIRAGRRVVPALRWLSAGVVCAAVTLASSYWFDSFECM